MLKKVIWSAGASGARQRFGCGLRRSKKSKVAPQSAHSKFVARSIHDEFFSSLPGRGGEMRSLKFGQRLCILSLIVFGPIAGRTNASAQVRGVYPLGMS